MTTMQMAIYYIQKSETEIKGIGVFNIFFTKNYIGSLLKA